MHEHELVDSSSGKGINNTRLKGLDASMTAEMYEYTGKGTIHPEGSCRTNMNGFMAVDVEV